MHVINLGVGLVLEGGVFEELLEGDYNIWGGVGLSTTTRLCIAHEEYLAWCRRNKITRL